MSTATTDISSLSVPTEVSVPESIDAATTLLDNVGGLLSAVVWAFVDCPGQGARSDLTSSNLKKLSSEEFAAFRRNDPVLVAKRKTLDADEDVATVSFERADRSMSNQSQYPSIGPQRFDRDMQKIYRRMCGEPEPLSETWQERFLQTLIIDAEFRSAVRNVLEADD